MRTTLVVTLLSAFAAGTNAFTAPSKARSSVSMPSTRLHLQAPSDKEDSTMDNLSMAAGAFIPPAVTAAMWSLTSTAAEAAGPDWGIFEGRTGSLLHPVTMGSLLLFSISTALLGFDWRRQRTIGDEITSLKKTMPDLGGASSVSVAIEEATKAEPVDSAYVAKLQASLGTDAQIKELQDERKELAAKGSRDKHYSQGALLAFVGTLFAIEGPLNTYARTGKLFPGPHLYVGAGLTCLWAVAVFCVPSMQKGNDTARTVHIGANLAGIGLFGWQVISGWPILTKVLEKTQWP